MQMILRLTDAFSLRYGVYHTSCLGSEGSLVDTNDRTGPLEIPDICSTQASLSGSVCHITRCTGYTIQSVVPNYRVGYKHLAV